MPPAADDPRVEARPLCERSRWQDLSRRSAAAESTSNSYFMTNPADTDRTNAMTDKAETTTAMERSRRGYVIHDTPTTTGDLHISQILKFRSTNHRAAHAACARPSVPLHLQPMGTSVGSADRQMRHSRASTCTCIDASAGRREVYFLDHSTMCSHSTLSF